jgi:nicotinate dehydrogenase subunit B
VAWRAAAGGEASGYVILDKPGAALSRRTLLQAAGALIVTFSLPSAGRAQTPRIGEDEPVLPGQVAAPGQSIPPGQIDAWLAIAPDGGVTLYTGKVELGTGVSTALAQIVAEELDVAVRRITVVQGDTARTPDQGVTAGSKTIQRGAGVIRQAAADARYTLRLLASVRLSTSVSWWAAGRSAAPSPATSRPSRAQPTRWSAPRCRASTFPRR